MKKSPVLFIFPLVFLFQAAFSVNPALATEIAGTITATKGTTIFIETASDFLPEVGDMVDVHYRIGEDTIQVGKWQVSIVSGKNITADLIESGAEATVGMSAIIHAPNPQMVNSQKDTGETTSDSGGGASLGAMIMTLDPTLRQGYNIPDMWSGVFVTEVKSASAADKAGLKTEDVIVSFDNSPVQDAQSLVNSIRAKKPGDSVPMVILRGGQPMGITATLDKVGAVVPTEKDLQSLDAKKTGGIDTINSLKQACDKGDGKACADLGDKYADGQGLVQDDRQAAAWYEKGCNYGEARACNIVGEMYEKGKGVNKDEDRAAELQEEGCNAGHARSCNSLGLQYVNGKGVIQDDNRAFALFEKSCNGGNQAACSNLGVMYKGGRGVNKDHYQAVALFEQCCNAGENLGCGNLGSMYLEGLGVQKDLRRAEELLQQSCNDGLDWSCNKLKEVASAKTQGAAQTSSTAPRTSPSSQQQQQQRQQQEQQQKKEQQRENAKAAREILPALLDLQRQMIDQYNKK